MVDWTGDLDHGRLFRRGGDHSGKPVYLELLAAAFAASKASSGELRLAVGASAESTTRSAARSIGVRSGSSRASN